MILQSKCIIITEEMLPYFLHVVNRKGGKTYFQRLNNYFVKQTKYSVNTVAQGPFRLPQPLVKLKAVSRRFIALEEKLSDLVIDVKTKCCVCFLSIGSQHITTFDFNSYTGTRANAVK